MTTRLRCLWLRLNYPLCAYHYFQKHSLWNYPPCRLPQSVTLRAVFKPTKLQARYLSVSLLCHLRILTNLPPLKVTRNRYTDFCEKSRCSPLSRRSQKVSSIPKLTPYNARNLPPSPTPIRTRPDLERLKALWLSRQALTPPASSRPSGIAPP